jgi:LPXTG-motif cell wall-anchored protein
MIQIFHESGFGGWVVLLFTIAGLAAVTTVGRRWGRPGSVAAAWAVAILAAGSIGFGAGQRSVDRAINSIRQAEAAGQIDAGAAGRRVALLSRGTAEAAGNYLLAGGGALGVLLIGGLLVFTRKKEEAGARAPAPAPSPVKA